MDDGGSALHFLNEGKGEGFHSSLLHLLNEGNGKGVPLFNFSMKEWSGRWGPRSFFQMAPNSRGQPQKFAQQGMYLSTYAVMIQAPRAAKEPGCAACKLGRCPRQ